MGSKSDAYEIDILKAATGQATTILTTTPITPWISLFTTAPTDSTAGTEVSGGSYARITSAGSWAVPAAGSVATNAVLTFPTCTADWGTIVGFGIHTAVTAGSLLYWGTVTVSKAVLNGDTASYGSGTISITED